MKRVFTSVLAIIFVLSLVGCAKTSEQPSSGTKPGTSAQSDEKGDSSPTADVMWAAIEADEYDNKTVYDDSFEMNTDEFIKAICARYPAPDYRPFTTDGSSPDDDYLIKAGTVSVYTHMDGICIALVITKDTHDLNDMKVVVFNSGSYSEFGVYSLGDLVSDFGKSEKASVNYDSAISVREHKGQLFLLAESAKGYKNDGSDYSYELRTYIVNGHLLNFFSDLKYNGSEGKRLTSRGLPMQLDKKHYTIDSGEYVLYADSFKSDTTEYTEIHNDFTKISEAVAAYFKCFDIERSKLTKKSDGCRLKYGEESTLIAEFSFHSDGENAAISLNDCTGIQK